MRGEVGLVLDLDNDTCSFGQIFTRSLTRLYLSVAGTSTIKYKISSRYLTASHPVDIGLRTYHTLLDLNKLLTQISSQRFHYNVTLP